MAVKRPVASFYIQSRGGPCLPRLCLSGTLIAGDTAEMVKKTADKCVAALLVLAAIVWVFGIGSDMLGPTVFMTADP